jgi:hypothetical protein
MDRIQHIIKMLGSAIYQRSNIQARTASFVCSCPSLTPYSSLPCTFPFSIRRHLSFKQLRSKVTPFGDRRILSCLESNNTRPEHGIHTWLGLACDADPVGRTEGGDELAIAIEDLWEEASLERSGGRSVSPGSIASLVVIVKEDRHLSAFESVRILLPRRFTQSDC